MKSKLIRLVSMPAGMPQNDDFLLEEEELQPITDGQLILKPLLLPSTHTFKGRHGGGHPPTLNVGDIIIHVALQRLWIPLIKISKEKVIW